MRDPIIDHEGSSKVAHELSAQQELGVGRRLPNLIKVTLVKSKQELILLFKALNSVRSTLGKIPDIAHTKLVNLELTILVYCRDQDFSGVNVAPFGLEAPVRWGSSENRIDFLDNVLHDASEALARFLASGASELLRWWYWKASR
jgi:hypothetical protein